jgi:GxxExxY protein
VETNKITAIIVAAAYRIHCDVGPGLFESVYEVILGDALASQGLRVARQVMIPVRIGEKHYDEGFRADLVVEERVIVEIKSVEQMAPVHKKQRMTYLRLSGILVGLLINFGGERFKGNIERVVMGAAPDLKLPESDHLATKPFLFPPSVPLPSSVRNQLFLFTTSSDDTDAWNLYPLPNGNCACGVAL